MGNISAIVVQHAHSDQIAIIKWETVTEADTIVAYKPRTGWIGHDNTVQIVGSFGGGTIAIKGSLDPDDVIPAQQLHKTDLTDLSFTAVGIFGINEAVVRILPVRTGGSSMDVDIYFMFGGN